MTESNKILQCMKILFQSSTKPRFDWFWVFYTIFVSVLKDPNSIVDRKKQGSKKQFLSNYLPKPITVRNSDGVYFIARPKFEDLARFLFSKAVAKWEPISIFKPTEKEIIVDVGANVGYYTVNLAPLVRKGKVISIEADPESCEILKTNCKLNNLSNVEIYNCAAADKKGEVTLYQSDTHSGINSIFLENSPDLKNKNTVVQTVTLDSLLENEKRIDWMKVDVEGAELSVLRGAKDTLQKTKRILIEIHEHILQENNENPEEVIEILEKNGFSVKLLDYDWDSTKSPNQILKSDYVFGEK